MKKKRNFFCPSILFLSLFNFFCIISNISYGVEVRKLPQLFKRKILPFVTKNSQIQSFKADRNIEIKYQKLILTQNIKKVLIISQGRREAFYQYAEVLYDWREFLQSQQ